MTPQLGGLRFKPRWCNMVALRRPRVLLMALVALFLVAGSIVASPLKASAVTCSGDGCSGVDPQSSGCAADAYTATVYNAAEYSLQTRYSPTCKTNWARLVIYPLGLRCALPGTLRAIQDTGYNQTTYTSTVCNTSVETTFWTPMIYSPVRLVRSSYQSDGSFTSVVYTPWA